MITLLFSSPHPPTHSPTQPPTHPSTRLKHAPTGAFPHQDQFRSCRGWEAYARLDYAATKLQVRAGVWPVACVRACVG